jgi:hypothetical protein
MPVRYLRTWVTAAKTSQVAATRPRRGISTRSSPSG